MKTDDQVITKGEAAEMIGVSTDTLDRMHQRGEGPPRVKLSDRRVGFRMRELRAWIAKKTEVA